MSRLEGVLHLEGDVKTTKLKLTWLADISDLVPLRLVDFDHLISKKKLEEGDDIADFVTPVSVRHLALCILWRYLDVHTHACLMGLPMSILTPICSWNQITATGTEALLELRWGWWPCMELHGDLMRLACDCQQSINRAESPHQSTWASVHSWYGGSLMQRAPP